MTSAASAPPPMTFSCPHYDIDRDRCWRLKCECVPGRPGCVMRNTGRFAIPAEQRVAEAKAASKATSPGAAPALTEAPVTQKPARKKTAKSAPTPTPEARQSAKGKHKR